VARRSGLGKGLSSLIPAEFSGSGGAGDEGAALVDIAVGQIDPNPNQPRLHFDEDALAELAESIREVGVLQPILVRPGTDGRYELIAGERRWRAARRAGLTSVPAIVRTITDLSSVEQALIENIHRQDLTPLEEAASFQQLLDDFGYTHDQLATRLGKSRTTITNTLRLLGLPPAIQHLLADGRLSAGHARALLGSNDRSFQEDVARRCIDDGWSVRTVEEVVRRGVLPTISDADGTDATSTESPEVDDQGDKAANRRRPAASKGSTRPRPAGLLELEELLGEHLDTRVSVTMTRRRGRIVVDFADLEDLERIYLRMAGGSTTNDT
jgi:ParB family transcriptional regulator, chromosome partitioning protein